MADTLTPERRSANMAKIRAKHTKPEMLVRRMVHGMGYRYRLHRKDLPGKPDLVFGPRRKVIFVHGCFWHLHDCRAGRIPASRRDYWEPKLHRNAERDAEHLTALQAAGWQVLTIWECETKDLAALKDRLADFLTAAE
ncbi:very short patch repair endonuclease [Leisingera sp. McT4-56]|uniref:very short patch repair endonuclease n=1 Tax=Leisingera sp. McT4-56 TaxID=2881255 RepID=UPI001CF86F79|nr:DNA mismatch endonuclease Vsr [Leisingera sp. McT4-56]MCB4455895.1 DNA mismatch endonuclease Vsr [Leisingera sp. McT4-56]